MQYKNTQNPISIIATFSLNFKLSNGDECLWESLFGLQSENIRPSTSCRFMKHFLKLDYRHGRQKSMKVD